jgi:hypothetical protein
LENISQREQKLSRLMPSLSTLWYAELMQANAKAEGVKTRHGGQKKSGTLEAAEPPLVGLPSLVHFVKIRYRRFATQVQLRGSDDSESRKFQRHQSQITVR